MTPSSDRTAPPDSVNARAGGNAEVGRNVPAPDTFLARARPWFLVVFRCVVAVVFLLHPIESSGLLDGTTPAPAMLAISVVEIILILLVVLGLYARIAALLLSGMMAFAYFFVHLPDGWNWLENGGEPAALYSWVFLLLFVLGPGPVSLDRRRVDPNAAA